jgi:predicted HNH restriction endonuclease
MSDKLKLRNVTGKYCGINPLSRRDSTTRILILTQEGIYVDGVISNTVIDEYNLNSEESIGNQITVDMIRANRPAEQYRINNTIKSPLRKKKLGLKLEDFFEEDEILVTNNDEIENTSTTVSNNVNEISNDLGNIEYNNEQNETTITIPSRQGVYADRIIRDTEIVKKLKLKYKDMCQLCGCVIELKEKTYSEGHHLKPLGNPHNGPDVEENIIIVCPNCHAKLDYKAIHIHDLFILKHNINKEYIDYHNKICDE